MMVGPHTDAHIKNLIYETLTFVRMAPMHIVVKTLD